MAGEDEREEAAPPKKGGRVVLATIAALLILTLAGAGGGGFLGMTLVTSLEETLRQKQAAEAKGAPPSARYTGTAALHVMPAIVTNLTEPKDTWVRLEAMLVLDEAAVGEAELLTGHITEDVMAYLRTLSASQIEGASGLQHLREDLDERVAIRSEGRVHELIIQSLVIQ